jgi:hypothetical protein
VHGRQGTLTRIWVKKGSRPRAPRERRYDWACIFGAACPARGTSAALVLPDADTKAFNLYLAEISKAVANDAHAVVILDGAGYHRAGKLKLPHNLTLIRLPSYSSELNAVKTSGRTCARTSSPTASSKPARTLSRPAARPGTSSPITPQS